MSYIYFMKGVTFFVFGVRGALAKLISRLVVGRSLLGQTFRPKAYSAHASFRLCVFIETWGGGG